MKVVFMGTPEFAVAALEAIFQEGHEIAGVVTAPDKPAGRGRKPGISAVKQWTIDHHIKLLQPEKLKNPEFLESLRELHADVFVVVAFRMLPEEVFSMPPKGTFNIHGSLLPNYRGAAPIHWAVMNGEKKTGVTSFFLNHEIDKGDIIDSIEVEIGDNETTGELYARLMQEGAKLAVRTLNTIQKGDVTTLSQAPFNDCELKSAPKIFKPDTLINWNLPAKNIFNKIRGLSPSPCAYTRLQNLQDGEVSLKCYEARISDQKSVGKPGSMLTDQKNFLMINTLDFLISLENVQLEGKSRMDIKSFLSGFRFENYTNNLF